MDDDHDLPLFDWGIPLARNDNPDTSHESAARANVKAHRYQALTAYRDGQALMDWEAYIKAGLAAPDERRRCHQRCSDLRQLE